MDQRIKQYVAEDEVKNITGSEQGYCKTMRAYTSREEMLKDVSNPK